MDYEDPYESLPPTSTPTTHMLAGSAAGILEHSVMYPVDCVKVCVAVKFWDPFTWDLIQDVIIGVWWCDVHTLHNSSVTVQSVEKLFDLQVRWLVLMT